MGLGILLWVIMFVIVSIFIGFNIYQLAAIPFITALIGGVVSYLLARNAKPKKISLALTYGLIWIIISIILDAIITTRFNATVFSSWTLWLGYLLGLLAPMLAVKKSEIQILK